MSDKTQPGQTRTVGGDIDFSEWTWLSHDSEGNAPAVIQAISEAVARNIVRHIKEEASTLLLIHEPEERVYVETVILESGIEGCDLRALVDLEGIVKEAVEVYEGTAAFEPDDEDVKSLKILRDCLERSLALVLGALP